MTRNLFASVVLVLLGSILLSRPAFTQLPAEDDYKALDKTRDILNPEFSSYTRDDVIERCAEHLATINQRDRYRIRYFDLTAVPRNVLPSMTSSLYFTCNSTARIPITQIPRPVPSTQNRIFWIDLAWFNWSAESWDSIASEEPYTVEPVVTPNSLGWLYLRDQTKTTAVIRGDWFVYYATDNGEFVNAKGVENFNPKSYYYQLLYSNVEFVREQNGNKKKVTGVGPETVAEFEKAWFVDFEHLKEFPIDKGTMVDSGFSGVAFNNRVMWRVRSKVGTYWRTFDVFRVAGEQDFVQTPFPREFDGGEHIFQDERGAQFYLLSDGKGKTVDFANPFLVRGDPSNAHNRVLVTGRSCIHCHDTGILAWRNEHARIIDEGVKLKAGNYAIAERFNQFFLQEQKLRRLMQIDQDNYAEFVRECTGLTVQENVQNFVKARSWYVQGLSLQQAAREFGTSVKHLEEALAYGSGDEDMPLGTTQGRLARLALTGQPLPRHTWERGLYQEAGVLLSSRK